MLSDTDIEIESLAATDRADAHVRALMGWLHRLIAWQIAVTRHTFGPLADDEYRGLYVPDAEVEILAAAPPPYAPDLTARRADLAAERMALSRHSFGSPITRVAHLFGLSDFEQDILMLGLAPEIDLRYERLYAYIQDDVTKKRPTVDLALRMLCPDPGRRAESRAAFAPEAPLMRNRLVQLFEDGQRHAPLPARFIKLDERIVAELLGQAALDPQIAPFASLTRPERRLSQIILADALGERLHQVVTSHQRGLVLALQGSYGSGRAALSEAICGELKIPLLSVALDRMREGDLIPTEAMRRTLREATLQGAAILWQGAGFLLTPPPEAAQPEGAGAWRQAFLAALDEFTGRSFLALDQSWEARGALRHALYLRIELPASSYTDRERIWSERLANDAPDQAALAALASTFRLSGGQIRDAVDMARALARWRDQPLGMAELYAACRAQSSGRLDTLAHKINATYAWNDIVLPLDQVTMLREICVQVRHRRTVLESWGFDKHLAMGKGVNVLFAGQSGTGKTMAAEIIAADLGLELYKVDLSTMVSKYIGETEKNLDKVFTAAREANAILFFDEADALFGKRSEVKDAHDRYANIEVGYLLQKMEEYDGIVILATNLRKNLDDAFIRRLHVAIDFPFPEEPDRMRIWRKVFPRSAPLADDVDLSYLAKQFKLAGGNIRNIALLSAYLSAEDGTSIGMNQIVRAIKREYQKLGKLVTETEFGKWIGVARG